MERSMENKARRLRLHRLERWVDEQHTGHFDSDRLTAAEIPIRIIPQLKPRYFQPYSENDMGIINQDLMSNEFPTPREADDKNEYWLYVHLSQVVRAYMPADGDDLPIFYTNGMAGKGVSDYGINKLVETPGFDPELHIWVTRGIYHYQNPDVPHLKCFLTSEVDGDERLLRGELLCLLRLMRARLRHKGFENHTVAPVLLISFMRKQHARIIEGYFDGEELVISKTPLYDFTKEENCPLSLFARYFLGGATGKTTGPMVADKCVLGHPSVVDIGVSSH